MSYARYDFSASLERASIDPHTVSKVLLAWGESPEGYGSWEGAFVLALKDGTHTLLSGWCDTSGWGCQDGVKTHAFAEQPTAASLRALVPADTPSWDRDYWLPETDDAWDIEPSDLNLWLTNGAKSDDLWE